MILIRNRQPVTETDPWTFFFISEEQPELPPQPWAATLVLPVSQLPPDALQQSGLQGVYLSSDEELDSIKPHLAQLQLIAIHIPALRDGRCFSLARLIRRAGYTGELRATGAVSRDRLAYLESCGFNSFVLPDDHFDASILKAFEEITVSYQAGRS